MNTNRIFTWGIFIVVIGLIIWGMIASSIKSSKLNGYLAEMDQASGTDWVIGNATSTITIVEYSDFQCPACAMFFPILEKVVTDYGDKIRFIYRNYPLPQHNNARPAAQAAGAAGGQGKFWEMYRMIFDTHDDWENATNTPTVFRGYAEKIGLDLIKYDADVNSDIVKNKIEADIKQGSNAGINATPTFYINGRKIENTGTYQGFKKLIDEAINNKNK